MYRSKLKLLYLFFALLLAGGLSAQDPSYFVYIQHEKHQPFYVKMNGKVISSSAKGYVILPKLPKGKVPLTIGFLKNETPEQEYTLRITGQRDYGYLLKSTEDKEFALYDLQTFATLKPAGGGASVAAPQEDVAVARISDDTASAETKAMMDSVQADVQAALAKAATDTAPASAPSKKSSFAEALDKVVKDDRPDDMPLEIAKPKPKPAEPVVVETAAVVDSPAVDEEPAKKRNKKKDRKEREALTEEERALLSSVLEAEKQAAADEALKETATATEEVAVTAPAEEATPAPAPKKEKKAKKKKNQPEPEFIDFGEAGEVKNTAEKPDGSSGNSDGRSSFRDQCEGTAGS